MKNIVGFVLIFSSLLFPVNYSSASMTAKSGTIRAVLTSNPPDPIALEVATFSISFSDRSNYFTLKRCACSFSIKDSVGDIVFQTPITQDSTYVDEHATDINYVFPKIGTYLIEVSGVSTNKVFEPFTIKFEQKIASKHIAPWILKLKAWRDAVFSDVLPVIVVLSLLPLGWKFLVVGKGRR